MKTTVDIPDRELNLILKYTGAKTKREAIVIAIKEFNQRREAARLAKRLGTFRDFMTLKELQGLRNKG